MHIYKPITPLLMTFIKHVRHATSLQSRSNFYEIVAWVSWWFVAPDYRKLYTEGYIEIYEYNIIYIQIFILLKYVHSFCF